MSTFRISNQVIGNERTFIIAEIGQNHQGSIEHAKQMIAEAKRIGVDCVKFQKSNLYAKFTRSALQRQYNGPNSWGNTYGEHKEYLEFSIEQYKQLQAFSHEIGILFTASAMDIKSFDDLYALNVPFIKIGSGDANNIQLLSKAAQNQIPLIISTGMQDANMVNRIVELMTINKKTNYCLLHCVSSYPTEPHNVNLHMLNVYRELFTDICLGYSGHEQGTAITLAAVLLGAKVVERHFTLDKRQKGTDHQLSLEPTEFQHLVTQIRRAEGEVMRDDNAILKYLSEFVSVDELESVKLALAPVTRKQILDCEMPCRLKLGKSLVYCMDFKSATKITENMICAKVTEPFGISAEHFDDFVGRTLCMNVIADHNLDEKHFEL